MTLLFVFAGYGTAVPLSTGYIDLHTRVADYALVAQPMEALVSTSYTIVSLPDLWATRMFAEDEILGAATPVYTGSFVLYTKPPDYALTVFAPDVNLHVRAPDYSLTKNVDDL